MWHSYRGFTETKVLISLVMSTVIIHLCFANDLMIFYHEDTDSVRIVKRVLNDFVGLPTLDMSNHFKHIYIRNYFNSVVVQRVLVNDDVLFNIMPQSLITQVGCYQANIIPLEVVMLDFVTGIRNTMGVLKVNLTIGSKTFSIIVL